MVYCIHCREKQILLFNSSHPEMNTYKESHLSSAAFCPLTIIQVRSCTSTEPNCRNPGLAFQQAHLDIKLVRLTCTEFGWVPTYWELKTARTCFCFTKMTTTWANSHKARSDIPRTDCKLSLRGPHQDAILLPPPLPCLLLYVVDTALQQFTWGNFLHLQQLYPLVAEIVCYHDMTDWVAARTILKLTNYYLGKQTILNISCLFSSKWCLYIRCAALSSILPCILMPPLGSNYFPICMRQKDLSAHARVSIPTVPISRKGKPSRKKLICLQSARKTVAGQRTKLILLPKPPY